METGKFCAATSLPHVYHVGSDIQAYLYDMFHYFGNKPFLGFCTQSFPPYETSNAYVVEEINYKWEVRVIPVDDVPQSSNFISLHVIYMIRDEYYMSLKLKSRMAPHDNEDSLSDELRSNCSMCSPVRVRLILSVASLAVWRISKIDVSSEFLLGRRVRTVAYMWSRRNKVPSGAKKFGFFSLPATVLSTPMPNVRFNLMNSYAALHSLIPPWCHSCLSCASMYLLSH